VPEYYIGGQGVSSAESALLTSCSPSSSFKTINIRDYYITAMGGSRRNFWGASLIRKELMLVDGVKCSKLTHLKHFTLNAAKNFINSFPNTSRVN